jgi:hypothetical protein
MALEQYVGDACDCAASSDHFARDVFVGPGHLILFQEVKKSRGKSTWLLAVNTRGPSDPIY